MKTVTSIVNTSDLINILTKFHKDWMKTINILTKFHKDWTKTINILTKFHKDWMKTVTSTVYTNKLLTDAHTHAQQTPDITRSHKLTMSLRDRAVFQSLFPEAYRWGFPQEISSHRQTYLCEKGYVRMNEVK
ncbi:hypothetical protein DPMN_032539 [Dreissena polymorpha]|uniref:Uncharacterized protein n=1 Tax=Dreissena polymorpha TaxID=45954 RepID=A0A9D4M4D4_DREPO|nr:hypothetical protein DPMN_032539 [Dreissena polymorpha]